MRVKANKKPTDTQRIDFVERCLARSVSLMGSDFEPIGETAKVYVVMGALPTFREIVDVMIERERSLFTSATRNKH